MLNSSEFREAEMELRELSGTAPHLLVELPSWHKVFRRNLADLFWPRRQPPLRLASKPAEFWPDVFVPSRLPWSKFVQSVFCHGVAFAALWGATLLWARRPQIKARVALAHEDVIYYQPSEYLPPLDSGAAGPVQSQRGAPSYAPQPIISVPREADNRNQTIVTPPEVKLKQDVALPNVVAWSKAALPVPIAATEHTFMPPKERPLNVPVVAPPPEVQLAASRRRLDLTAKAVAPAPQLDSASGRVSNMNIGPSPVVAPAPKLAVEEQRTLTTAGHSLGTSAVVPPPPAVQGTGRATAGGRLIALGIHPVAPAGPVEAPSGNRRGSFAATPQGKPGASGMPEVAGNSAGEKSAGGSGASNAIPPGLLVGAGPGINRSIGGNGEGQGAGGSGRPSAAKDSVLMAKVTPPRVRSVPQHTAEISSSNPSDVERAVFGDRKFYSMTLNIPNLNSASGSWVIHFAQMNGEDSKGDLVAPSAEAMSDPAYPLELMRQHVQGTVILYAVIRTDGTVADIRVLNSADERLDEYARQALARWRFRPASKNGTAVALEAVVKIPFRPGRMASSF
jgi:TonB family protein